MASGAKGPRAGQPKRRAFSAAYKLKIVEQYEQLANPRERGALLRREGLYHSHVQQWREARLLEFCRDRQADVTRFCYDSRVWPTNNISERGVRPVKTQQKISGRLTSEEVTQDRLDIRSHIDTARKHGHNVMDVLRTAMTGTPWRPSIAAPFTIPARTSPGDNPCSEAQFKTLKYCPAFPGSFASLEQARAFCDIFFTYYNNEHRHSGIGLHTPAAVHDGSARDIQARGRSTDIRSC